MQRIILLLGALFFIAHTGISQAKIRKLSETKIIGLDLKQMKDHPPLMYRGQPVKRIVIYGSEKNVMDYCFANDLFNYPCDCGLLSKSECLDVRLPSYGVVIEHLPQETFSYSTVYTRFDDLDDFARVYKTYTAGENDDREKCKKDVCIKICSDKKSVCYVLECGKYSMEICYDGKDVKVSVSDGEITFEKGVTVSK